MDNYIVKIERGMRSDEIGVVTRIRHLIGGAAVLLLLAAAVD